MAYGTRAQVDHLKVWRRQVSSSDQERSSTRISRFNVTLSDSASTPAALEPTAPMGPATLSLIHSAAKSLEV